MRHSLGWISIRVPWRIHWWGQTTMLTLSVSRHFSAKEFWSSQTSTIPLIFEANIPTLFAVTVWLNKKEKKLRPIFHKYESISFFTLWAIVGNSSRVFTPSIILYLLNHLNLTIIMFTVKDASLIFLTNTLVLFVEKYTEYFSMASFLFFLKRAVFFTKWKQPPLRSNNHIVLRCHSVSDCKSFPNDL